MTTIAPDAVWLTVRPAGPPGLFHGRVGERDVVTNSRTPFFVAARKLLAEGADPGALLVMRHRGGNTASLRAPIGAAAKLTVKDGNERLRFVCWRPFGGFDGEEK